MTTYLGYSTNAKNAYLGGNALNVKAYGAVGDGVTDDTTAIQDAIDAAEGSGDPVYVPSGTFVFSGLTISSPTWFVGAGANLTASPSTLIYTGSGVAIDITSAARGTELGHFALKNGGTGTIGLRVNCNDPRLHDLFVFNTTATNTYAGFSTAAIDVGSSSQVNDFLMRDCYIRQQPALGLRLQEVSEGVIDHCRLVQNRTYQAQIGSTAAGLDAGNIQFVNGSGAGVANQSGSGGFDIQRAAIRLVIDGCYFESDSVTGAHYAVDAAAATVLDSLIVQNSYFTADSFGSAAAYGIVLNSSRVVAAVMGCIGAGFTTSFIKNVDVQSLLLMANDTSDSAAQIDSTTDVSLSQQTAALQLLHATTTLGKSGGSVGFYGVTPIARATLATGGGATVDQVITALQNLGLVKQS